MPPMPKQYLPYHLSETFHTIPNIEATNSLSSLLDEILIACHNIDPYPSNSELRCPLGILMTLGFKTSIGKEYTAQQR